MLAQISSEGNTFNSPLSWQSRSLFFSFVGIAVTSAGIIIYDGRILWTDMERLYR